MYYCCYIIIIVVVVVIILIVTCVILIVAIIISIYRQTVSIMIFSIKVHAFTVFCCSFIYSFVILLCYSYSHLKSSLNRASLPFSHFRDTHAALSYTQLCLTSISGYCPFNLGSQYYRSIPRIQSFLNHERVTFHTAN